MNESVAYMTSLLRTELLDRMVPLYNAAGEVN